MKEKPSDFELFVGLLQACDLVLNSSQVSNDRLLQELERQNKEYLTKIIEQNETIIKNQEKILQRLTSD